MTRAQHFDELAVRFKTDKGSAIIEGMPEAHNYMPYYARILPLNPKRLLEIGCGKGASLRMWRDIFPNCELHTLDLFEEHAEPTDIEGLICHKGNQRDFNFLAHEFNHPFDDNTDFDIIIDDGGHGAVEMKSSFDFFVNRADIYVIEDLHCLEQEHLRYVGEIHSEGEWGFEPFNYYMPFEETILGQMKSGKFPHRFDLFEDKIAFIYKD